MRQQLPLAVELDVVIDHAGHSMLVKGREGELVFRFSTLSSLLHFLIASWPARNFSLAGHGLRLEWRRFGLRVRRQSATQGNRSSPHADHRPSREKPRALDRR